VYVLSEPTLAISVGHRPANSRPADPTREYEPGSGESHDPAPVHRPHPPRPPPAVSRPRQAARVRGRPSGVNGALARIALRRPAAAIDPGASATAARRQSRQATGLPSRRRPAGDSRQHPAAPHHPHAGLVHHARQHSSENVHHRTNEDNGRLADGKGLTGPFHMSIRETQRPLTGARVPELDGPAPARPGFSWDVTVVVRRHVAGPDRDDRIAQLATRAAGLTVAMPAGCPGRLARIRWRAPR
jgi:hypothetical protein